MLRGCSGCSRRGGKVPTFLRVVSGARGRVGFFSGPVAALQRFSCHVHHRDGAGDEAVERWYGICTIKLVYVCKVWTLPGHDFILRGLFMLPATYCGVRLQDVKPRRSLNPFPGPNLLHSMNGYQPLPAKLLSMKERTAARATQFLPHSNPLPQTPIFPPSNPNIPSSPQQQQQPPIRVLREFEQDTCIRASAALRRRPAPPHLIRRANHTHPPRTSLRPQAHPCKLNAAANIPLVVKLSRGARR
ncbi:hypothetical protein K456DRAFT_1363203 [Colletotrichum gloeosporioides 23]|nr:hypothetical protein K456DRAFT_1363203 [Colletotrichum gloeosporioides 23]